MAIPPMKPLDDKHCDCLDDALRSLANYRDILAKCRDCGVPFEPMEDQERTLTSVATKLKANFFPERV